MLGGVTGDRERNPGRGLRGNFKRYWEDMEHPKATDIYISVET